MKKRIINLIIAVLFTSMTAFASITPSIFTDGFKTFVIDTKAWKSDVIAVEIWDSEGYLIFHDEYTTEKNKRFNFKRLPNGSYTIVLEDEYKSTKQDFAITKNNIELSKNVVTTYKPVITIDEEYINLNYLSNNDLTVVDLYSKNENIFSFDLKEGNAIHKRFNTNQLPKGDYTFTVTSGGNIYSTRFKK